MGNQYSLFDVFSTTSHPSPTDSYIIFRYVPVLSVRQFDVVPAVGRPADHREGRSVAYRCYYTIICTRPATDLTASYSTEIRRVCSEADLALT